jgi:hypothetical protein
VELITGHPETKASHSRASARGVTSRLWEETERGLGGRRAVLWASLLRLARLLERSVDRQAAVGSKIAKTETAPRQNLLQVEPPIPPERKP